MTREEMRNKLIELINEHGEEDIHSASAIGGEDNVIGVEDGGGDLFFIEIHYA